MIYSCGGDKLNFKNTGIAYGFMDGSLDFDPPNLTARKELLNIISAGLKKTASYSYEVKQSHGTGITVLGGNFKEAAEGNYNVFDGSDADGVFTRESGIVLCIRTADCAPVLFADTGNKGRIIGAVHCGWKGAYGGIIRNAKNILTDKFNADIGGISVMIGPSICKKCYEVKEDFLNLFLAKNTSSQKFFNKIVDKNKIFFDLKGFIRNELILNGFNDKNIYDLNKCNFEDAGFFSYRRDKDGKRQVSFIAGL
jgi:hypothetical protein